ncbi:hypothetical protein GCM10011390_07760 [Aureimonas endophytica]|uniref:Uncharacterized protein n=1 Tax=Aureimonas endophytica TaxID=2027858 RepID=A0A916ZEM5_9HYPH|nr:hypothetical protein [Aureimonas endophytica]GGD91444.1 hypothetical protein GCM10011390_07760 [Aureimonas endophytica]
MSDPNPQTYVTTHFRTLGYAGALLFTLAPPFFFYEIYLTFYTTAVEENPTIGPFMAIALVLSFASIPMMLVGRRQRYSISPTTDESPRR